MTRTEFWGREVKPGQTVSCDAGDEYVIRISQVALGDTNKKKEEVAIYVKVDHWQIVIGTLMAKRHPHMMCDLTFEKEFELSHSSQTSSVFFCGYKNYPFKYPFIMDSTVNYFQFNQICFYNQTSSRLCSHDLILAFFTSDGAKGEEKGKHKGKAPAKLDAKMDKSWDDDLPSSGDMDTYEDSISSTDNLTIPSYSDEDIPEDVSFTDQDVSLSQTHELETSEKSAGESVLISTSVKAKVARSGKKSVDKMGSHVATPNQGQKSSKVFANSKSKDSKSTGNLFCEPCNRTFVNDVALQAHRKAKHTAAK